MKYLPKTLVLLLLVTCLRLGAQPIPVKVAVVVTYEIGADRGDQPGEFQFWVERENWTREIKVPGVDHPVLTDGNGTIGVVPGTTVRASNQIMALVLSGLFDFSKTYWIVNGGAGVDPAVASIGSAAWAHYVVDGDIYYEIDSREADPKWPYAITPIGSDAPNKMPKREGWEPTQMAYQLNASLVDWAFALTKNTPLQDNEGMKQQRSRYVGFPQGQRPPFVLCGETLGTARFWHGKAMTQWAEDWTRLWTGGKGVFAMSECEDQGISAALTRLSAMGRVDFKRVLFLRSGGNYCMPPPKEDTNLSMHAESPAHIPSLEALYAVGSQVLHELAGHWDVYADKVP
jgi:purine nucleoside permease